MFLMNKPIRRTLTIRCTKCGGQQKTIRQSFKGSKKCVYCGKNITINRDTIMKVE